MKLSCQLCFGMERKNVLFKSSYNSGTWKGKSETQGEAQSDWVNPTG